MTFPFQILKLQFDHFPVRDNPANFLRGNLGAALRRFCDCENPKACPRLGCDYGRIFDPPRDTEAPSGLRDPLRPFVLRGANPKRFELNVFDSSADRIVRAWCPSAWEVQPMVLDLTPSPLKTKFLTIDFLSPTDLRTFPPSFATLFARARDRVSTLRATYGPGPLEIDFRALGELASGVSTESCDLQQVEIFRRSASNGRIHPLGGFTGTIVYSGEFSELYPILYAGQYTGVGRKTVWGNGHYQIRFL